MSLRAIAWQPHGDKSKRDCRVATAPRNDIVVFYKRSTPTNGTISTPSLQR
jgi:hypothetical protein